MKFYTLEVRVVSFGLAGILFFASYSDCAGKGTKELVASPPKEIEASAVKIKKEESNKMEKATPKGGVVCELPKDKSELKKLLSPEQYRITQQNGTEKPFTNSYWNEHRRGIYVDVVSGEPLFSSETKFDSGTGWPSFTKPIEGSSIVEKKDMELGVERIEIRSKKADSHLGHVFDDGPNGQSRYCINSASLRFVPFEDLEKLGYGHLKVIFSSSK